MKGKTYKIYFLLINFCIFYLISLNSVSAEVSLPTVWYLAEGATLGSFDEWILIQNPNNMDAYVHVTFMMDNGRTKECDFTVKANSRYTIYVNSIVPNESVSAKLESTNGVGIIAERAMYWDSDGMDWTDGHDSLGLTEPSNTWYFAEGCTRGFYEWLLIQNPNNMDAYIDVTFMRNDGSTIVRKVLVPSTSRYTIYVNSVIPDQDVSIQLQSTNDVPVLAERAMYWDRTYTLAWDTKVGSWAGGHCSTGAKEPDTTWYFAEGCTNGFDEWILVQNPNSEPAECALTIMKSNGAYVIRYFSVNGTSRYTIKVNDIVPNESLSAKVESTNGVGIVAERAMYWNASQKNINRNTYIAFGDSITRGFGGNEGYPSRLEKKIDSISNSTIYNEGSPGELTDSGLGRIEGVLRYYNAEYILIMEGTNDVSYSVSSGEIASNLRGMVNEAKALGVKPILANIICREDEKDSAVTGEVNPAIENLASDLNVPFVDQYSGIASNRDKYMADYLHPNDDGYEVMSNIWFNKIKELNCVNYSAGMLYAGHCSIGVNSPADTWYLAEGATLGSFSEWVLIQNPDSDPANCTVTFMKPDGSTVVKNITVNPTSRYTIKVNDYVPNNSVSTKVESTNGIGIIVERAMYWDVDNYSWGGGHNSIGVSISN